MTLPSSGPIDVGSIEQLVSGSSGYQSSLSWLKSNTKDGITDLGSTHGRNWYKSTTGGNCNTNPVPTGATSSGNIQCTNCSLSTVNCVNCDSRAWLQADCNCACTYNCTTNQDQSYDCNCNCNCFICDCACW